MIRLGLDIDGVFANFNDGMADLLATLHGSRLTPEGPGYMPDVWHWPQQVGYRQSTVERAWAHIEGSRAWWRALAPLHDPTELRAFFRLLSRWVDQGDLVVYFLTSRTGELAHYQTVQWLMQYEMSQPQVIVTSQKGDFAAALRLDVLVDDLYENLAQAAAASEGDCRTALVLTGYNQAYRGRFTWDLPCDLAVLVGWLGRFLPRVQTEGEPALSAQGEPPSSEPLRG